MPCSILWSAELKVHLTDADGSVRACFWFALIERGRAERALGAVTRVGRAVMGLIEPLWGIL